jgi:MSHA biogenesis protein MshI
LKWNFSWKTHKNQKEGMVGIYQSPAGIAVVYGVLASPQPVIKAHVFEATDTIDAKQAVISKFVIDHALQGVDCTYVLDVGEYSLNLVESPLVAVSEIPMAMRWVLKDLINYPIEEAIIDTFDVPVLRARDNIKMIYAAAIHKQQVEKIATFIKATGLVLKFIDIPEMTLKNMLVRHPQKFKSCALAQLSDKSGKLILCKDDQLCISRSFELQFDGLGQNPEKDSKTLDSLALEFQRSFDYMNSVFRQSIQNMIVLAPTRIDKSIVEASLKANLGADIAELKLAEIFKFDTPLEISDEVNYLFSVGAVLRTKEKPT